MTKNPFVPEFGVPLKVEPMRVRRTYSGGTGIDRWHNEAGRFGLERPEEWLASVTPAINPGFAKEEGEGLSRVEWQGKSLVLKDLLTQFPQEMLGDEHWKNLGEELGILAKMIDSAERLSIQVHPDKAFSRKYFHSDYGKTECWYILQTCEVQGQKPYLLMGFRPGVTRERWQHCYEIQDIRGMIDCMHKVTPKAGEVWLIDGGFPHAIGPGCCLIELQEPTDYTLRTEKTRSDGSLLPEQLIHQGAGEEGLMECFHYDTLEEEQLRRLHCLKPECRACRDGSVWKKLVGVPYTQCFSMVSVQVKERVDLPSNGGFQVAVVVKGEGRILSRGG